jgi:hypothetical protein
LRFYAVVNSQWTGIPIKWELRKKGKLEPDHHEDDAAVPDIDAIA